MIRYNMIVYVPDEDTADDLQTAVFKAGGSWQDGYEDYLEPDTPCFFNIQRASDGRWVMAWASGGDTIINRYPQAITTKAYEALEILKESVNEEYMVDNVNQAHSQHLTQKHPEITQRIASRFIENGIYGVLSRETYEDLNKIHGEKNITIDADEVSSQVKELRSVLSYVRSRDDDPKISDVEDIMDDFFAAFRKMDSVLDDLEGILNNS